jgi:hypothetical protein
MPFDWRAEIGPGYELDDPEIEEVFSLWIERAAYFAQADQESPNPFGEEEEGCSSMSQ